MGFRTQGEPVAQDKRFVLRKSGRGQVGSQEAQPWVPRGEFYFNSIANVKGDFRKRGQGQRDREHWGSKKTYSLMNWKRLIFNMLICYAVML